MKSIKEKAIEVFPRHCNANTDYSNFKKRIGFNRGANYVLEQIEKLLDEFSNFEDSLIVRRGIEQLKSNR